MASLGSINPNDLQSARPISSPASTTKNSSTLVWIVIIFLLGISGFLGFQNWQLKQQIAPTTYEACVLAAGSIIQESYPATCITKLGTRFTQPLTEEEKSLLHPKAPQTDSVKQLTMQGCGMDSPNVSYSIKVPRNWELYMAEKFSSQTEYRIFSHTPAYLEIACDTTDQGNTLCLDDGEIHNPFQATLSSSVDGCFWTSGPETNEPEGLYLIKNAVGTFTLSAHGIEKSLLETILSTFTFTP